MLNDHFEGIFVKSELGRVKTVVDQVEPSYDFNFDGEVMVLD